MLPSEDSAPFLEGKILAADPTLLDPNFKESLVFLAEHSDEGAFGLILNRPTGKTLAQVVKEENLPEQLGEVPLLLGGPVSTHHILLAVFKRHGDRISVKMSSGAEDVTPFLNDKEAHIRAFAGYAGWGGGQLEGELIGQSWKVCPPHKSLFDPDCLPSLWTVYANNDTRWQKMTEHLPEDPSLN